MSCQAGVCAAVAILLAAAPAHADDWPLIDVKARLANDGRVTVVETHRIPRLRALGLGSAIDRWRERHRGGFASPPDMGERPLLTSTTFTGVRPEPYKGPEGWATALALWADDDSDADDEESDADAGATPAGRGRDER